MSFADFFLRDPASFPTELEGTPWGAETIRIRLAGRVFRFTGLSRRQALYVRTRYAGFLDSGGHQADIVITAVYRSDPGDFRPIEVRPWIYSMDMEYGPLRIRIAGLQLTAVIDWGPRLGAALWSAAEEEADFRLVFENVFRVLTAYAALQRGGVLLHSAGVSSGRTAWIGFGHSGAGKSTLSRLSLDAGKQVLSDDINVIRPESGRWQAQRIPFAGELGPTYGREGSYPIEGICRLTRGSRHALEPLRRGPAMAALVASAPYVNQDPYRVVDLMENLEALIVAVPSYDLSFARDAGFWSLLERASLLR